MKIHRISADGTLNKLVGEDVPSSFLTQIPLTCFALCRECSSSRTSHGSLFLIILLNVTFMEQPSQPVYLESSRSPLSDPLCHFTILHAALHLSTQSELTYLHIHYLSPSQVSKLPEGRDYFLTQSLGHSNRPIINVGGMTSKQQIFPQSPFYASSV